MQPLARNNFLEISTLEPSSITLLPNYVGSRRVWLDWQWFEESKCPGAVNTSDGFQQCPCTRSVSSADGELAN